MLEVRSMSRPHFLNSHAGPCQLVVDRTGAVVASHLELALTSPARRHGLLGRIGLAAGHGLLLAPCQGIHTARMRFDLDVVALDRDGVTLKCRARVRPWRVMLCASAFAIVELPAGTIAAAGLREGERLRLL
jgi:uncharacterized membrane protein (UPF0127 family)